MAKKQSPSQQRRAKRDLERQQERQTEQLLKQAFQAQPLSEEQLRVATEELERSLAGR